jgi:membrane protein implicated in regulation of membrane protease activity
MRKSRFWLAWGAGNLIWLFGAPLLLGIWISASEPAQVVNGVGASSPRDSPQILMAGFVLFVVAVAILVNATWGVVALARRRRRQRAPR